MIQKLIQATLTSTNSKVDIPFFFPNANINTVQLENHASHSTRELNRRPISFAKKQIEKHKLKYDPFSRTEQNMGPYKFKKKETGENVTRPNIKCQGM